MRASHTDDTIESRAYALARGRLERAGADALEAHELLVILGIEMTAGELEQAGGLRGLLDAPEERIASAPLDAAQWVRIRAIKELHLRWSEAVHHREGAIRCPFDARKYLEARLRGHRDEVFAVVFLDTHQRVIRYEELFRGTVDGCTIHMRHVVRRALEHNACGVVFGHNHPAGIPEPSRSDRAFTMRLVQALATIDVKVVDHVVVGDAESVSFQEREWLKG